MLSNYIIELTGIAQEHIDCEGLAFSIALSRFLDFADDDVALIFSWGSDERVLEENAGLTGSDFLSAELPFRDIRPVFASLGVPTQDLESGTICQYLGILPAGSSAHDALSDSRGILLALRHFTENGLLSLETLKSLE